MTAKQAGDPREWLPRPPYPEPKPKTLSQADEALRRVIAAKPEEARPLPTDPAARRRAMRVRGLL